MMKRVRGSVALACCLTILGTVGCGDSSGGKPVTLAPVSGTVTLNGSPLAGARVDFFPENGPMAVCTETGLNGEFTLKSGALKGCAVGPAKVAVYIPEETTGSSAAMNTTPKTPEEFAEQSQKMAQMTIDHQKAQANKQKSMVPARYRDPASSGLDQTIEKGGSKEIKLELKD